MKNLSIHKVIAALFLFVSLSVATSCGDDDAPVPGGNGEVYDDYEGLTVGVVEEGEEGLVSFAPGTSFGVFVFADITSYAVANANAHLVVRDETASRAGLSLAGGAGICGYSPYNENWSEINVAGDLPFGIVADQRADSVLLANDLMIAPLAAIADGKATLRFSRVMARVNIRITDKTGKYDLNDVEVCLPSRSSGVMVNLLSGNARTVAGMEMDINACVFGNGTDVVEADAVLPPDTVEAGSTLFTFSVGGNTFSYIVSGDEVWESGKRYTYSLELAETGLTFVGSQVDGWESGNEDTEIVAFEADAL